jgi:hypothetical protein
VGDRLVAVDDGLIVHPAQQTGVVEVVQLGLAVGVDRVRERHAEHAPRLPVLRPRLHLVRLDPGPGEDVRLDQVMPGGVASKVARGLSSASTILPSAPVTVTRLAFLSKTTVRPVDS